MNIICLGINHRTAPASLRERLSYNESKLKAMLARSSHGEREAVTPFSELGVLSTCNRVELYAVASQPDAHDLVGLLAETSGVSDKDLEGHTYDYQDSEAADHLFRVASGLDSLVLGEPQILGQVSEAHTLALRVGASGLILSRLFQAAIHAGKRARSETAISSKPATVSSVAVHLIASQVRQLEGSQVLVIGAGEMAELAVEALRKRTVGGITVINRTVERAAALASRWGARSRSFEALEQELERADVVISSTAAPHPILNEGTVRSAMAHRPARPLIVMDIAFPRDVEEAVGQVPGVHLYDLDKLEQGASRTAEEQISQVPQVERIIGEEMERFQEWLTTLEVRPVIRAMREQAEAIRQREIRRTLRHLDELSVDGAQEIESLTKSLVNKLLHEPTVRLKQHSQNGQGARYALLIRELFGLGDESEADPP